MPLLCRRGGVTRNDIGAIRIAADETFVGIAAAAAARFAKAVAQPGHDEDNDVEIIESDGPPRQAARENRRKGKANDSAPRHSPRPFREPRGDAPGGEGKRPFRKGKAPSRHGVKHKTKGNRPR